MKPTLSIRITVRGRLTERLAAAFDGMTLMPRNGATDLVGEVVDQAQLHGLLTRIRDLGLELESMGVVDTDPDAAIDSAPPSLASAHSTPSTTPSPMPPNDPVRG